MLIAQLPTPPVPPAAPVAPIVREIPCPAVTQMLKFGAENPLKDVSNVQRILRDVEHMNVFVDGDYNEETRDAVITFQKKYASEILGPWGPHAQPTGIVSLTTMKKLNQIACGGELTLNEREMRFISVTGEKAAHAAVESNEPSRQVYSLSAAEAADDEAGASAAADQRDSGAYYPYSNDMMTASVGSGSIVHRFGAYFKNLFR